MLEGQTIIKKISTFDFSIPTLKYCDVHFNIKYVLVIVTYIINCYKLQVLNDNINKIFYTLTKYSNYNISLIVILLQINKYIDVFLILKSNIDSYSILNTTMLK